LSWVAVLIGTPVAVGRKSGSMMPYHGGGTDDWEVVFRQNLSRLLLLLGISLPLHISFPSLSFFSEDWKFALHLKRFRVGLSGRHDEKWLLAQIGFKKDWRQRVNTCGRESGLVSKRANAL
jgi:hypothetical protein